MITVNVTAEDIANGTPSDPSYCAIALALRRMYPGAEVTVTSMGYLVLGADGALARGRLSNEACDFVHRFDQTDGASAAPETFQLVDWVAPQAADWAVRR